MTERRREWTAADERAARRLTGALYRFDCPPPQTIGEYQLDLLAPEERTRIAAHVLECPHCTAEVQQLRAFLNGPLIDPQSVHGYASGAVDRLRRVVASLLMPPRELAYGGLRGTTSGEAQTYRAGEVSITLGPGPRAAHGRGSLMGLVWSDAPEPEPLAGREVRLIGGAGVASAAVDELGNFVFDDVVPAAYQLELTLSDQVVVIEDVQVSG